VRPPRIPSRIAAKIGNGKGERKNMPSGSLIGDNRQSAFDLDDDQRVILDQADRFARNELYGLSERMDADEWWPEDAFPKIGQNGLFGVTIPEEYGGGGPALV
jgi:isovaleryl-CoA dehydrogenase